MKQVVTKGVVLSRTDFGEADRILTVLTPDHGKVRLMAKGVRRIKSKLAGGIELFSVSDITYLPGRKEIGTLVSSRLAVHYGNIAQDINRTMAGYEILRRLHKATEDDTDEHYFALIVKCLAALDVNTPLDIVESWFLMQLLRLGGHEPNLKTTSRQQPLSDGTNYTFDLESMALMPRDDGDISVNDIKLLRLLAHVDEPQKLTKIQDIERQIAPLKRLIVLAASQHIRD